MWWVGSSPGGEHVWTDADEFGDAFERPAHIEHDTPIDGVVHSLVEIGEQRCCSLDGDEIDEFQFGCSHLAGELAWSMRVPGERPWEQWAQHTAAFDVVELVEDVGQISVQLLGQHTVTPGMKVFQDDSTGDRNLDEALRTVRWAMNVITNRQLADQVPWSPPGGTRSVRPWTRR